VRGLAGFLVFVVMVISKLVVRNPAAHCGGEAWLSRLPATPRVVGRVCQQPAMRSISFITSWTIELVAAARPRRSVPYTTLATSAAFA